MGKKRGRPINFQTEEIKVIIDQYVRFSEARSVISASKVAKFAKEQIGIGDFEYYVINRNDETKCYLDEINCKIKNNLSACKSSKVEVFKTIDIGAMLNKSPQQLQVALQNINLIVEDTSDKYSKVLQENISLNSINHQLKSEIEKCKFELETERKKRKENEKLYKVRIAEKEKELEELRIVLHVSWDNEAESILAEQGIFIKDESKINEKSTIVDPTYNLVKLSGRMVKVSSITSKSESVLSKEKLSGRKKFLKNLEEI